ncbi:type I 3-dehydroquinate dehydratase [Niallia taxi]|uniref:type I 3-dehydroquinate dehydratase n=1 Tax=Niallia taxi TaxID=2499688 RepID=UPI0029344255|nr:type I 3-dehydroquinate dehydratase [Niallia taxi]MED3961581.1 type I 3-dehydroquinate dehydratase [Niallia taxi]WOD63823.1 type I 3-dehydroquinate dehydratase [Niallia taxi]
MVQPLIIRDIAIGEGIPKICASLIGETASQLKEEAHVLITESVDVIEWRVDFFEKAYDKSEVLQTLANIRSWIGNIPLVFTFRSKKEGGEKELEREAYIALNKAAAKSGYADIIDVELFNREADVKELVEFAHAHKAAVIVSNHDFNKTPAKEEIISRLRKAQELGGDLPKIALMPQSMADVITLLDAVQTMKEQYADRPIIAMSMGGQGSISRIAGEAFGSALTFGAAKKASAPGQIPIKNLKTVLTILHESL